MPVRSIARITPNFAWLRLVIAVVIGLCAAAGMWSFCSTAVSVLIGWDAGGLMTLVFSWSVIMTANARETAARAAAHDPGRHLVYVLVLFTSAVSLFAAVVVAKNASIVAPFEASIVVYLCLATVAIAWLVTHTAFTLRYAHLHYRDDDEGVGGIELPRTKEDELTYFDFAYFAFTLGMCFQVSDATISSPQVRKVALFHGLLSFAYNTAVLAFALNLAFGSLG